MIPFCKTSLGAEEKKAIADCIDSGWTVYGPKCKEFEAKFAEYVGGKYAVFVDSGTSAMLLALAYLNEKIHHGTAPYKVPSLTFCATAEALVHTGNRPIFVDVEDNFLISAEHTDQFSLPVHLLGDRAPEGAFVYDSAHRIEKDDVKWSRALWCYSFYATKNMTTVQGGRVGTNSE